MLPNVGDLPAEQPSWSTRCSHTASSSIAIPATDGTGGSSRGDEPANRSVEHAAEAAMGARSGLMPAE